MLCSDSPFNMRSRMIPLELFRLLCLETDTFRLKNYVTLRRFSVCDFWLVSTNKVLFLSFFTDFGVPINDSICFSMTKGDKEVTGFEPS